MSKKHRWTDLPDNELLKLRFCDLGLSLRHSPLAADVEALHETLARRHIKFKPHVWLSTDWFSPDGIPGIAVPFFAAHPRLAMLERRMKGEAEGTNRRWRQRILRHEAGHALDTAFGLRRRRDWRQVFGPSSKTYPHSYAVRPASRRFVQHLGHWYAQSHPTEDFAETFAVWLQPKARWQREYAQWPALHKLKYVDEVMTELANRQPGNRTRTVVAPLKDNRRTLNEHYKRNRTGENRSDRRYDGLLTEVFVPAGTGRDKLTANRFLRSIEPELRRSLKRRTGAGNYLISHVMESLRCRANALDLVLAGSQRDTRRLATNLHETVLNDLLARNRERYVL